MRSILGGPMSRGAMLTVCALLGACASAPEPALPDAALPAAYGLAPAASNPAPLQSDWWTLFGDPVLDGWVDAALTHNADLRLAVARVDETAAVLGLARAAQWPGLELGAAVTRSRVSTLNGQPAPANGVESTTHRAVLSTAFEIDLWGRLRNATAAAQAQLLSAAHARDTVRLAVAGSVVQAYFGLRTIDAQLAVLARQRGAREDSLQIVERRVTAGVASSLEAAQARAALAATRAQEPELQRQRALLAHQLGLLAGQQQRGVDVAAAPLPQPVAVPAGLPAALLVQRPDVMQAEQGLRAAQAQVEVARAALFPTLSLTGSFGGQSADLVDLLKGGARIWSLGPSLLLPLFDGGRNAARTAQAQAQAEQAAIRYQQAAQTAYREVADALAGTEQGARLEVQLRDQQDAVDEVVRVARLRHEAGYSGYLEVLDAERGAQDAELALVRARQLRLDASVALMKALGGGWSAPR